MGDDKGNGIQSELMVNCDGSLRRLGWLLISFLMFLSSDSCRWTRLYGDDGFN